LLQFLATGAIIDVQGQNIALHKIIQPIMDTLEEVVTTIRRILSKNMDCDEHDGKSRERDKDGRGRVVPVG
jgi:hypothetical protein